MKKLIVILMLIAVSASARLDESKEECIKRYGESVSESANGCEFIFKGFTIYTIFIKNNCEFILYEKDYNDFTKVEIDFLLKVNCSKGWKKEALATLDIKTKSIWSNSERKYLALHKNKQLFIQTKVWGNFALDRKKKEDEKQRNKLGGL